MARYSFLTTWELESPATPIWDAIYAVERWPEWWRGVTRVRDLGGGGRDGVGRRFLIAWRSSVPYELEFEMRVTRIERPRLMEGTASGDLAGSGRWRLFETGATTSVTYEWDVETTKRWMNLVAPLARPVFAWNHDIVMRRGGQGLSRLLGVRLLAAV